MQVRVAGRVDGRQAEVRAIVLVPGRIVVADPVRIRVIDGAPRVSGGILQAEEGRCGRGATSGPRGPDLDGPAIGGQPCVGWVNHFKRESGRLGHAGIGAFLELLQIGGTIPIRVLNAIGWILRIQAAAGIAQLEFIGHAIPVIVRVEAVRPPITLLGMARRVWCAQPIGRYGTQGVRIAAAGRLIPVHVTVAVQVKGIAGRLIPLRREIHRLVGDGGLPDNDQLPGSCLAERVNRRDLDRVFPDCQGYAGSGPANRTGR